MEEYFTYFVNNDCLICEDSHLLTELIEKFYLEIIKFKQEYCLSTKNNFKPTSTHTFFSKFYRRL